MTYEIEIEGRSATVTVRADRDGGWWVTVDGSEEVLWEGHRLGDAEWFLREGGAGRAVGVHVSDDLAALQIDGHALRAVVTDPRRRGFGEGQGVAEGTVRTPMPGVIVRIPVSEGDAVSQGDVWVVVEAMKMENEYRAALDGVVSKIHVGEGESVDSNAVLVTVEPS